MNLEDHVGDIIGKAQVMSGLSSAAAARAAGLTEAELTVLEETGRAGRTPDYAALAALLGLHRANWKPSPTVGCRRRRI